MGGMYRCNGVSGIVEDRQVHAVVIVRRTCSILSDVSEHSANHCLVLSYRVCIVIHVCLYSCSGHLT